jgi:hypothetical protein
MTSSKGNQRNHIMSFGPCRKKNGGEYHGRSVIMNTNKNVIILKSADAWFIHPSS